MKRIELAILAGLICSVIIGSFAPFTAACSDIRGNVLRLHIMANSNSKEDQELKLRVRDRILEETGGLFTQVADEENARKAVEENMEQLVAAAQREVWSSGYDYPVSGSIQNMYFTTRVYGDVTMPAGYYDAVSLTIGEAQGRNWWCVVFPPMCVGAAEGEAQDASSQGAPGEESRESEENAEEKPAESVQADSAKLDDVLDEDEVEITTNSEQYEFKFALLEIIQGIGSFFKSIFDTVASWFA